MARQTFTSGQVLTATQVTNLQSNAGWNLDLNAQTGTTYTVVAGDVGKLVTLSNAGAITVTFPAATFTVGDQINFVQLGAGAATFAATNITRQSNGAKYTTNGQYALVTAVYTAASTWLFVGNLVA
jgi:hypothetical protein